MGFFSRFRKKKKEGKAPPPKEKKTVSDLEVICGDDKEVYEALKDTLFLNPGLIKESMEEVAEKAKEFEKSNPERARILYEKAGGLAIYQGDIEKVEKYFGKCKELFPDRRYKILEIPERAVKKAQEYYQIKAEEKK